MFVYVVTVVDGTFSDNFIYAEYKDACDRFIAEVHKFGHECDDNDTSLVWDTDFGVQSVSWCKKPVL